MFSPIVDYIDRVRALLLVQFSRRPRLIALVDAISTEVQAVDEQAYALVVQRTLADSTGAQLDQYGDVLGLARHGWSDARYRAILGVWITILHSKGNADTLITALQILAVSNAVTLREYFPCQVALQYDGDIATSDMDWARSIAGYLRAARAPGVLLGPIVENPTTELVVQFNVVGHGLNQARLGTRID